MYSRSANGEAGGSASLVLIGFFVLLMFTLASSLLTWLNARDIQRLNHTATTHGTLVNRFCAECQRNRAGIALYKLPYQPELAREGLNAAIQLQPLNALTWLDTAELHVLEGDVGAAREAMLTAEQLWPTSVPLLWRVAMLSVRLGDNEKALERLARIVEQRPKRLLDSYAIAQRLSNDPKLLLSKFVDRESITDEVKGSMVRSLAKRGLNTRNMPLNEAISIGYGEYVASDKDIVGRLAQVLWREKKFASLGALWQASGRAQRDSGTIENSGFEAELGGHIYGWFEQPGDGVTATIDDTNPFAGDSSLSLSFDGTTNRGFVTIRQIIPISQPGEYELRGYWKGSSLSTLSGIFIDVVAWDHENGVVVAESAEQRGTWAWKKFLVEFELTPSVKFVEIRTRRRKSSGLDNRISGTVWFDEMQLSRK